ncbi:FecR family protein [Sphingobacterium bambusae]|uniref:FecR family protein n=1 Tax=Sphingobacterium bambusae TaxID=662858 RepID=A0ABW6BI71_9SPHI|nr:FecR domain-containing protein [Sphingobacterium bambusae]WPL50956.1 FecR domain-containing protein [Sphingobacterium bambusae]
MSTRKKDTQRFTDLLQKQIDNRITEDELLELHYLLELLDEHAQQQGLDQVNISRIGEENWPQERQQHVYGQIAEAIQVDQKSADQDAIAIPVKSKTPWLRRASLAASIVIMFALSFFAWNSWIRPNGTTLNDQIATEAEQDIYLQENNTSSLRLPNGRQIALDSNDHSALAASGLATLRDEQGNLYYRAQHAKENESGAADYFTFTSAKGRTTRLVLSDGTEVTLNSASSIRYPRAFSGTAREVQLLDGEAFFDVTHDASHPFLVKAKENIIKVLGTSFNVSAYADDEEVTTTLLDGAVHFSNGFHSLLLQPGEQVTAWKNQKKLFKKQVDVLEYTLWRDGFFMFDDQSVSSILTTVKRWYDIDEVSFLDTPSDKFSGTFKRTKSLKQLLKNMQKIGHFNYEITGRRIIIMN